MIPALILLAALQLAALACVTYFGWRRLTALVSEIADLRTQLRALQSAAVTAQRRVRRADALQLAPVDADLPPALFPGPTSSEPERARRGPVADDTRSRATLSPETLRSLVLAMLGAAPAVGFLSNTGDAAIVASGIAVAAGMMLVALRPIWRVAAWSGAITGAVWALIGIATGAAQDAPLGFATVTAIAGLGGLVHAYMRRAAPGLTLALAMAAATLALGSQTELVGAAGAAFGVILAGAAIIGSLSLRLEGVHLAAFGAALVGLFVLSGQEAAAIWFTPAVAWAGALFLAISVVRTPYLGARGATLAGTGALAPLAAIAALNVSGHGLADGFAAAGALLGTAGVLAGIVELAARRRSRGIQELGLTLWILSAAAFAALAGAIALAAPVPVAAAAFMASALGLAHLDRRAPSAVWRALAWAAAVLALGQIIIAANWFLTEAHTLEPFAILAGAFGATALLSGAAAHASERSQARATAALFEILALGLAIAGVNLGLRQLVSGGALLITPISFPEAGLHISVWLAAALLIAAGAKQGAQSVRRAYALGLGAAALLASAGAMALWLTSHWNERAPAADASALLRFDGLGFLGPAILFWAHWVFWRATGAELRTRISLAAGTLMTASLITLEVLQAREGGQGADWLGAAIGAVAFALAIGINLAPGVTATRPQRPLYFEENLKRNRRRQLRRQTR